MTESNALTITDASAPIAQQSSLDYLTNANAFEHLWRVATAFSGSKMVPVHFQNKPQDTFIAIQMALQIKVDPFLCLQNIQVINNKPSFSASFLIGLANTRGPFAGPLSWTTEGEGESLAVTCHAKMKADPAQVVSVTVSMAMAKAENWTKNPKYRSIPEQMLRYRSATWLIRLYCPEVSCGMQTEDEIIDVDIVTQRNDIPAQKISTNEQLRDSSPVEVLNKKLAAPVYREKLEDINEAKQELNTAIDEITQESEMVENLPEPVSNLTF